LILAVSLSSILTKDQSSTSILAHIGDFYGIMAVAVCSSQKAFRFLHNLVLAIVSIIISSVSSGICKNF
jgi:nicotinamide riboside transporter PnuC